MTISTGCEAGLRGHTGSVGCDAGFLLRLRDILLRSETQKDVIYGNESVGHAEGKNANMALTQQWISEYLMHHVAQRWCIAGIADSSGWIGHQPGFGARDGS